MSLITRELSDIVGKVFEAQDLPHDLGQVRISDRPDLAQFQCNGAMAAAKIAKKNPREIAQNIVDKLLEKSEFSSVEIAGPGFINLNVTDEFLLQFLLHKNALSNVGNDHTVVIDYGGMNVAKAMHVGHLRSLAIGSCIKNILNHAGYNALGDIHMGDWGLQMGQIISEFEIRNPEWPYFDESFDGVYPNEAPFTYDELEKIYPEASQACKEDPDRLALARKATMELQEGRKGYMALWQYFIDLSIEDIKRNLALLGVDFEIWNGEACVNHYIPEITKDLKDKGVTIDSDGAVVIPVAEDDDKHDIPPLMFLKSDGAATYGTTDIATIYDRIKTYPNIKKMVYETDLRQNLHFEQVFRAVKKAGYVDDIELVHIGHGTVNGKDGKPFKTREGKAMKFADMIGAVIEKASQRLNEADLAADLDSEGKAEIARLVAISALKFNELSNQPHMDYIFDLDRMTSFEGKTGPYLLYQAVRIKSLLRKAEGQGVKAGDNVIIEDGNRGLALLLSQLPEAFEIALRDYAPHHLCEYAYKLASEFSKFYAACHILSETDSDLRASRLKLCEIVVERLQLVLDLLGITAPDRM